MNAVIYSRVSTFDQDNQRAIDELKDYAKYKKYKVLKVFEEKITGASKATERIEFKKLLDFISKEKVDHLLVWELSRIGRNMADVVNTVELLSEKKINIYIKKEGMSTLDDKGKKSIMTSMIISVLSGFAEMERETIRQRSISGIRANVARGGSGTGRVMAFGYKSVDKKLIVDIEESEIIKLIFTKYLSGLGTLQIANHLNDDGIKTRFNKIYANKTLKQKYGVTKKGSDYRWKDGTIYRILTNPIYIGQRRHKGEIFKVTPIIDESIFNKVQVRLSSNYNKKGNNAKYSNPLSDILICGKCGRGYFMHKRADKKDNAYKCISKRYGEYCGNPSVNIDKLLDALYKVCQPMIYSDAVEKTKGKKTSLIDSIENKEIVIKNINKEVEQLNQKLNKLIKLNLAGELTVKQFSLHNSEIKVELTKKQESLIKLSNELEKIKMVNSRPRPEGDYTRELFDNYVKDAIDYIKVYEVNDKGKKGLLEAFPVPYDIPVMIEVKSSLVWDDKKQIFKHFALSRWSGNISFPKFAKNSESIEDYKPLIEKGNYTSDFHIHLNDFPLIKQLKNLYIKKKGAVTNSYKYNAPKSTSKTKIAKRDS